MREICINYIIKHIDQSNYGHVIALGNKLDIKVLLFLLRKSKNGGTIRKNMLFMDPVFCFSFFVLYGTVRSQTGPKVTRVGSATEMKTDRSEFIFRSVMHEKKCMETDTNSYQSEFVPVSCKYPPVLLP